MEQADKNSDDLGWCEVCEEQPATTRAKRHWDARICAACAEEEPMPRCSTCGEVLDGQGFCSKCQWRLYHDGKREPEV